MILKKIDISHFVLLDNSILEHNDWYFDIQTNEINLWSFNQQQSDRFKKIIRSTIIDAYGRYPSGLNLEQIRDIVGELHIENKAKILSDTFINKDESYLSYITGYYDAIEDNKEKKYTEEDMRMAYFEGKSYVADTPPYFDNFEQFIQSLQPKTQWEVEIVDGKLKLK